MKHPLLNKESSHYSMIDGVEAIERMEEMYTVEELKIWSKMTAMKYRLRIGKKDDVVKEAKKIETYEAYYKYLEELEQPEKINQNDIKEIGIKIFGTDAIDNAQIRFKKNPNV